MNVNTGPYYAFGVVLSTSGLSRDMCSAAAKRPNVPLHPRRAQMSVLACLSIARARRRVQAAVGQPSTESVDCSLMRIPIDESADIGRIAPISEGTTYQPVAEVAVFTQRPERP